jgi:hypothetical protein
MSLLSFREQSSREHYTPEQYSRSEQRHQVACSHRRRLGNFLSTSHNRQRAYASGCPESSQLQRTTISSKSTLVLGAYLCFRLWPGYFRSEHRGLGWFIRYQIDRTKRPTSPDGPKVSGSSDSSAARWRNHYVLE